MTFMTPCHKSLARSYRWTDYRKRRFPKDPKCASPSPNVAKEYFTVILNESRDSNCRREWWFMNPLYVTT